MTIWQYFSLIPNKKPRLSCNIVDVLHMPEMTSLPFECLETYVMNVQLLHYMRSTECLVETFLQCFSEHIHLLYILYMVWTLFISLCTRVCMTHMIRVCLCVRRKTLKSSVSHQLDMMWCISVLVLNTEEECAQHTEINCAGRLNQDESIIKADIW